jgi:uncharacterized protein
MKVNSNKFSLTNLILIATFIGMVAIIASIWFNNNKKSYPQMILDWRNQKDTYFRTNDDSPIMESGAFTGLTYFKPNEKYKVEANLILLNDTVPVSILRTDGKKSLYLKYAFATFILNKKEYQLTLFKPVSDSINTDVLFVPFTDRTSGELTYKAGRYLDLKIEDINEPLVIDFNYAYNPFCAYNPRFSCPIPPIYNFLDIEIPAGEKIFEKNQKENSQSIDSLKSNN